MSMVVLPFANLGGDPGQDYIADAVTDDLTAALALSREVLVIGRGTAFTYKGRAMDARQVGRELGVRYVVEGSARRLGDRLRVNAQLLDAATGAHLWVHGFDEPFAEIAGLTHMVAVQIASALGNRLLDAEIARAGAERPHNPDAVDLVLRGRALLFGVPSPEAYNEARLLFERAIALGATSAGTHALLAHVLMGLWTNGWSEDQEGLLRRAEEHIALALARDPRLARAHYVSGMVNEGRQRFDLALAEFDVALSLAPNFAAIYSRRGRVMTFTDRPAEAMAEFRQAIRISPREPNIGIPYNGLAFASLMLDRVEDAVAYSVRAVASNPDYAGGRFGLARDLALAGRREEARTALGEYLRLRPGTTIAGLRRLSQGQSGYPLYSATWERGAEALRAIGMPEE
ncbi:hypothetical protein [Siccirubricoccus sp. G192]|uniref:hypothetical protein n=1 Tax=Siccirubricoccus sp. G192 TaxID=2849651 RepID=UPI0020C30808|nr:hypothetical protein [Siccirubricoccus sp. G192]